MLSPLVKEEVREYTLTGGEKVWSGPVELSFEKIVIKEDFHIRKDKNIAYFDYDKLTFPLTLRTWKEGDWFIPFGMKGRKKLSDYFSDHKFSRLDKERTWLLCSGGAVIWLVHIQDQICCVFVLTSALSADHLVAFEHIHTLAAAHGMVIGGGESIGDALLIPNPVPAVHRLPVNGISGDTEYRVRFCDQRDIVPTRTVTG